MVQRSIVNRTDIDEDFLLRIEDTGIRIIIQRINNSNLEEGPVYHRFEPRITSLEVPSNPQFIDSVSTSTEHGELICQSSLSSTQSTKEQEICDLCSKTFTKRQNIVILAFI